ncbi:putative retrotransposon ty1-copia subclass protein [Tanacetum coccineum]
MMVVSHNILGIAPVATIDRQLPFEYTIASRSTDVMVWNAVYDAHNEVACLMLGTEVEWFDLIQTFHACKQEEGKLVSSYILKMKGYVEQLERLGYVLSQDLSVGLIMASLYEKGLPKKPATPQVMAIQGGRIQKAKQSLNAKGKGKGKDKGKDKSYIPKPKNPKPSAKEHPAKDDACHHYKEVGHCKRNYPAYLAELIKKKKKQVLVADKWVDAMNAEMQSMKDNQVWYLVDLPPNCKTIRSKWLFKKKTNMDGIVHTYKSRLVAKGYTQTYVFDYEETFSPVVDISTIRILIAITAFYDYEIWQMDVKTAFLNGYLNEDIYMVQLEGFVDPNHPMNM